MHQITVLFNGRKQAVWLLDEAHIVIGRGRSAHIPLDDNPIVSRQHAVIRKAGTGHVVEDLGGANGTFVNDVKIDQHTLKIGERVTIGKHTLRYEHATPEAVSTRLGSGKDPEKPAAAPTVPEPKVAPPPWSLAGKRAASPMPIPAGSEATVAASREELEHLLAQMKLKSGPHLSIAREGRIDLVPLDDPPIRIGNHDECEIRMPGNKWFGKVAAEIVQNGKSWVLVARSPFWNPVFVGQSKVQKKRKLSTGTMIKAGELKLRFSLGEQE